MMLLMAVLVAQLTCGTWTITCRPDGSSGIDVSMPPPPQPPVLTALSPTSVVMGSAPPAITATGSLFDTTSTTLQINGSNRVTNTISTTQLTADLVASDLAVAGTLNVTIVTPGGTSNALPLAITSVPTSLKPTITGLSPGAVPVGSSDMDVTITGINFATSGFVFFAGSERASKFISPTQVIVTLRSWDFATAGSYPIIVANWIGGASHASGPVQFQVFPPAKSRRLPPTR